MSSLDETIDARDMHAFVMNHFRRILSEWPIEDIVEWLHQEQEADDSFELACAAILARRQLQAGEL